jgi:hypothetical protein
LGNGGGTGAAGKLHRSLRQAQGSLFVGSPRLSPRTPLPQDNNKGAEGYHWGLSPFFIFGVRGAEAPLFHGTARVRYSAFGSAASGSSHIVCDGASEQQVPRLRKIIRLADDLAALGMTKMKGAVESLPQGLKAAFF